MGIGRGLYWSLRSTLQPAKLRRLLRTTRESLSSGRDLSLAEDDSARAVHDQER